MRILVTGASGKIGREVVAQLLEAGYAVRGVTSDPDLSQKPPGIEWRHHDFRDDTDVLGLVAGCDGVIHLAAHLWDIPAMNLINADSTGALAAAAARTGVRVFCLASSISVYGSSKTRRVDESAPVIPADRDDKTSHRGTLCDRSYARSKVLAEAKLAAHAEAMECVILRPPIVADLGQYGGVLKRSGLRFFVYGKRREQFIYTKDVAHAFVWFIQRALSKDPPGAGLETYNLCYGETAPTSGAQMRALAYTLTAAPAYQPKLALPIWAYNLIEMIQARRPSLRYPLSMMRLSGEKLRRTGYEMRWGPERVIAEIVK